VASEVIPDPIRRDVRSTLADVFRRPTRLRQLLALGPRGWLDTARFVGGVIPRASRELAAIRARAATIPDPALREQALASIDHKAYHVQGGAILATFLPPRAARRHIAAVAALETIYDYLDNLCDRLPGVTQQAYATLHEALLDALDERRPARDYYRDGPHGDDGGYLRGLVERTRAELRTLPSYPAVRDEAVAIARFYTELQVLKHGPPGARERACEAWHARHRDAFGELTWWEFASACGSSLPIFALLALASRPALDADAAVTTARAYFPSVSAVHILLDYFIDQAEDAAHGELNFVACYDSRADAVERLGTLVATSLARVRTLHDPHQHRFLVQAMCVFYLTHAKIFEQGLEAESAALLRALDVPAV
jgi:tetraprenyl-beta-curcumene synthase